MCPLHKRKRTKQKQNKIEVEKVNNIIRISSVPQSGLSLNFQRIQAIIIIWQHLVFAVALFAIACPFAILNGSASTKA